MQRYPAISESCQSLHFSLAILLRNGRYVLQLRDNKPGIAAPGLWALFGGAVEQNEAPEEAVRREVYEELGLKVETFRHLWTMQHYSDFFRQPATYRSEEHTSELQSLRTISYAVFCLKKKKNK